MEKALLNVNRFNSADVIATSGDDPAPKVKTCAHTRHYKITNQAGNPSLWAVNIYEFSDVLGWHQINTGAIKKINNQSANINDVLGDDFTFCDNNA